MINASPGGRHSAGVTATLGVPGPAGFGAGELAMVMAEVALELQRHHGDLDQTVKTVATTAVAVIPGVDFAYLTVAGAAVGTGSATGPIAEQIRQIEQALGEGPGVSAMSDAVVQVDHQGATSRWPRYRTAASALGVDDSIAVQLYVRNHLLGSLSLLSTKPGALTNESVDAATLYAAHAAIALFAAELEANLTAAIGRRDLIGQAKGIFMERFKIGGQQAFALLVRGSQNTNTPLREVAEKLTFTGDIAGLPTMPSVGR